MRLWRKRKLRCVLCGREQFVWLSSCSDEFMREHECPSGYGCVFVAGPASLVGHVRGQLS